MKMLKKIVAWLLALCTLIPLVGVIPAVASTSSGTDQTRYTQKIVSVVYDNSGSMLDDPIKEPAARYSLEMLMSLLDERDQMIITPMNDGRTNKQVTDRSLAIEVDLSAADRNAELDRVLAMKQLKSNYGSGTPAESMGFAIEELTARGLKDKNNLINSESDKEYWLLILTDGKFSGAFNASGQAKQIEEYIKNYPTLRTVYVGFGKAAEDLSNDTTLAPYLFTPYKATETELASVIQQISNTMSGRFPLDSSYYIVNGNTVTVNLEKIEFSLAALSLMAQNCGEKVVSAKYSGSPVTIDKPCEIVPNALLNMKSGFSCELIANPYLMGGSIEIEFSGPIDQNNLSIFVEPALDISYYLEAQVNSNWETVDLQYINANLSKGDEIRVGYVVREQVNGNVIDLNKVFGDVVASAYYNQTTYKIGEAIPLIIGSNELMIEVSVMNGAYTLRDSETITIEESPTHYRIETSGDTEIPSGKTTGEAVFTVFVENRPATAEILKNYTYTITANSSDGKEANITTSVDRDGKIHVLLSVDQGKFDMYSINMTVESSQKLSRSATHNITYFPSSLDLTVTGSDHITLTQHGLVNNTQPFTFELTTGGQPFPFDNGLTQYTLLVDGVDMSLYTTVEYNKLTFIPTAENLGDIGKVSGDKNVSLIIKSASHPSLDAQAAATLTVNNTLFAVICTDESKPTLDRFDIANNDAVLYFTVHRDGVPLSLEELTAAYESGELKLSYHSVFKNFALPCGIETAIEEVGGVPVLAVRVVRDMKEGVSWFCSGFIFGTQKSVSAEYADAITNNYFEFEKSGFFAHFIRIFLLIIINLAIIYNFIIYPIGFFVARPLPRGAFIEFSGSSSQITPVNETFWKKYGWLIFIRLLTFWNVWGCQPLKVTPTWGDGLDFSYDKSSYCIRFTISDDTVHYYESQFHTPNMAQAVNNFHQHIIENHDFESYFSDIAHGIPAITSPQQIFNKVGAQLHADTISDLQSEAYYVKTEVDPLTEAANLVYALGFLQF